MKSSVKMIQLKRVFLSSAANVSKE